jgi:hypothetical protein
MTKRVVRASFMAHLRAGPNWSRGEQETEPLGPVLLHPAGSAENDLLRSVERPASRHADHRGATRVAIHFVLTWVVRSCLRTVWPIRPPAIFCQRKHARDAVSNGANIFGDRADELAVKPVRNKNRISAIIEVAGAVANELINLLRCPGNNFTARLR